MQFSMVLGGLGRSRVPAAGGGGPTYTLIASDAFGGTLANFTPTNTADGGSTSISGGVAINSAALDASANGGASNVWTGAGSWSADQRSKANVITTWLTSAYFCGVIVRATTDLNAARDFYAATVEADSSGAKTTRLWKVVNGTYTSLATASVSWNNSGDTIALDVVGGSLTVFRNDVAIAGLTSIADSSLSSGSPGFIVSSGGSTSVAVDNWDGYNVT